MSLKLALLFVLSSALALSLSLDGLGLGEGNLSGSDIPTLLRERDSLTIVLHNQQLYIEKHQQLMSVLFTVYNPVEEQTDSDPHITASGKRVKHGDLAVSRDFLKGGFVLYGDSVYVLLKVRVTDTMNKRYTNRVDFLHMYHKNMSKNIDEAIKLREQNGYIFK